MIAATCHDRFAREDYRRLRETGIRVARDGLRWHLVEPVRGTYDFTSLLRQLDAAETEGVEVIWDLFHYGYPDDLDIFSDEFPSRLADLAAAFTAFHKRTTGRDPSIIPVNEISFFSWIAGDIGHFHPYTVDRGDDLKRQLVLAALTAIRVVRDLAPQARILSSEPAVHVMSRPEEPHLAGEAEAYRCSQYQALDMLLGRLEPQLGGMSGALDFIGINYYPHNQWFYPDREMIELEDPLYRPLSDILVEVYERYDLPLVITETGTEDERRAPWFRYVSEECRRAQQRGVDLRGICLYPIVNHPGWEDERHCHNGLWDYCDPQGGRQIHEPLLHELGTLSRAAAH